MFFPNIHNDLKIFILWYILHPFVSEHAKQLYTILLDINRCSSQSLASDKWSNFRQHCYETSSFIPPLIKSFNLDHWKLLKNISFILKCKTVHFCSSVLQPKMIKIPVSPTHLQSTWPPYSHSFLSWIPGKKAGSCLWDGIILINGVYRKSAQDN